MEELHAVAFAYYTQGTEELKIHAEQFFNSMDTNNDEKVSYSEFMNFLRQRGYDRIIGNLESFFRRLDRDHNNSLDFPEVLTLYYIIKTRYMWCEHCGAHICGCYFTCVTCFDYFQSIRQGRTYDLCPTCYGDGRFTHNHTYFLDNHVLLRSKRNIRLSAEPDVTLAITPQNLVNNVPTITTQNLLINHYHAPNVPQRPGWYEAFGLLEVAVSIASNGAIM